ncbi:ROK family transcriptional regulator [Metabacillus sp. GX 13764]|uniref:ROK family transcriptional regulator n=1 Tax=Metabacillus kandeliae TaxID=2900151 RepID=UPI001E3BB37D|nr:ROK family transcriptional regulator [Metabacillus kandeliae]MCD7034268.1 ROK family transcriptional regulator [Metabacillus kandeliae]
MMNVIRNGSKELIKDINRFKVLKIIREKHPISRVEIAKLSALGMSTLTYIIEELTEQGYIFEIGESTSTGGRRARLIEFNKNFGYIVSIKVEEERLLVGLTNMDAEIIDVMKIAFKRHASPESIVSKMVKNIKLIFEKNEKSLADLKGIGLLSSGLVNRSNGMVIRSSLLDWSNVPISEMLKERFRNIPVMADKNINGYALAEISKGEGKESGNFVLVSVGSGVGLSVVIDGKINYGSIGGAGEFGHTTIAVDGYLCHCGQRGCLEMYASEFYFENKGKELLLLQPNSGLKSFKFEEVAEQAINGDEIAGQLVDEMASYLGHGIRNLINTLNPEKIVIAGEGMKYGSLFMDKVRQVAQNNFFSKVGHTTKIVESRLNDDAWLVGGSLLVLTHIFQLPIYQVTVGR